MGPPQFQTQSQASKIYITFTVLMISWENLIPLCCPFGINCQLEELILQICIKCEWLLKLLKSYCVDGESVIAWGWYVEMTGNKLIVRLLVMVLCESLEPIYSLWLKHFISIYHWRGLMGKHIWLVWMSSGFSCMFVNKRVIYLNRGSILIIILF